MHISRYNLMSLYNLVYLYVLRADHLALDNQLLCSFWEEWPLPLPPRFSCFPIVLWTRWRHQWAFPCPLCQLASSLFHLPLSSHVGEICGCRFWCYSETRSYRKNPWFLQSFHPLFCNVLWSLGAWVFCKCTHWNWALWFCRLISCGFL